MSNENKRSLDLYYGNQSELPEPDKWPEGSLLLTDKGRLYDGSYKKLIGEDLDNLNVTVAITTATLRVENDANIKNVTVNGNIKLGGKITDLNGNVINMSGGTDIETPSGILEGAIPVWNGSKFVAQNIDVNPAFATT